MALACRSMDELVDYFSMKVEDLRMCLLMRGEFTQTGNQTILSDILMEVIKIEGTLAELKRRLTIRRQTVNRYQNLKDELRRFDAQMRRGADLIAASAVQKSSTAVGETTCTASFVSGVDINAGSEPLGEEAPGGGARRMSSSGCFMKPPEFTPMYHNRYGYVQDSPGSGGHDEEDETVVAPTVDQLRKMGPLMFIPSISYLTATEFDNVPKNIKSRITLEMVNACIDEVKKAVTYKYKLLSTPRSKLSEPIHRQLRQYEEQENKETKGSYFVVDKDLMTKSSMVLDKIGLMTLAILRHCDRIREVRGNGLTRYLIVQPITQ